MILTREGTTLMGRIRGQWFNATSNLFAFCTSNPEKVRKVRANNSSAFTGLNRTRTMPRPFPASEERPHLKVTIRQVNEFQAYLVRLVSLLHCAAIQQVADMDEEVKSFPCPVRSRLKAVNPLVGLTILYSS